MPLPSLKTILPGKEKKKETEYFLALELGEETVKTAIWEENEKIVVKALAKGKTVKEAVSKVKEKSGEDLKIKKVIFGLPPYYVFQDKIKAEYLARLKKITSEFSLSPLGFLVIPEAISHLLEIEEETPQTAILIGISERKLTLSLFRGGRSKRQEEITRTDKIYADLEKGLSKFFEEEVLPSKIILYDEGGELTETKEELLSYPWQKNERFLHMPKIETVPWDFSIKAIVEAGVSELKKKDVRLAVESPLAQTLKEGIPAKAEPQEDKAKEEEKTLGFIAEKDIVEEEKEKKAPKEKVRRKIALPQLKLPAWPSFSLPEVNLIKFRWPMIAFAGLLLIIFGGLTISSFYFYPQAKIILLADPQVLAKQIAVTLNTNIVNPNIEKREIPGKVYSTRVQGEKTAGASGKKIIGEQARGEVTLYNKTVTAKTFKKNTLLSRPGKLKFTLDEEATVASASDTGVSLEYGKEKVKVTAESIGPAGNLEKNNEFSIADFPVSSYLARNEASFSGGTEREITTVSSEDQEKLLKDLTGELANEARKKLETEKTPEEKFLEESLSENIVEKVFDKEIESEADNLSLKLTLEFSQTSFKEEDFNRFLGEVISEQVPPDFEFDPQKTSLEISKTEIEDDGSVVFTANYKAYLLPKIDLAFLRKNLLGKSLPEVEKEIRTLTDKGIIGYELSWFRRLPFLKNKLPLWENNIEIEISNF